MTGGYPSVPVLVGNVNGHTGNSAEQAILERYYCEIKTDDVSLERSQIKAVIELASGERILNIWVSIEQPPNEQFTGIVLLCGFYQPSVLPHRE
jgi:hypothetical protein